MLQDFSGDLLAEIGIAIVSLIVTVFTIITIITINAHQDFLLVDKQICIFIITIIINVVHAKILEPMHLY